MTVSGFWVQRFGTTPFGLRFASYDGTGRRHTQGFEAPRSGHIKWLIIVKIEQRIRAILGLSATILGVKWAF
jgi:hypothetical protein